MFMKTKRQKAIDEMGYGRWRDMAYITAHRNGFDKRYCSSMVKRLSPEEIREVEAEYFKNR